MIKVSITTINGNVQIADDSVVSRQGTEAYKAIVRRDNVFIKNADDSVTVIPFKNIAYVNISSIEDTGDDLEYIREFRGYDISVTDLVDPEDDPDHAGKYVSSIWDWDYYIFEWLLVDGCRYKITLPDGTVTDPITAVRTDDGVFVRATGIEVGMIFGDHDFETRIYSDTELSDYDFAITYVDGGENDSLNWEEVFSTNLTTEYTKEWHDDGSISAYLTRWYARNDYHALILDLDSTVIPRLTADYAKYKIVLGNLTFYAYSYIREDYNDNTVSYQIGLFSYLYPAPVEIDIVLTNKTGSDQINALVIRTRDKASNIPLRIYAERT